MSDTTLNRFLASGTNAQRLAFTPSPPTPASGPGQSYIWTETDTGNEYWWNAATSAWVQFGASAGLVPNLYDLISVAAASNADTNAFATKGMSATAWDNCTITSILGNFTGASGITYTATISEINSSRVVQNIVATQALTINSLISQTWNEGVLAAPVNLVLGKIYAFAISMSGGSTVGTTILPISHSAGYGSFGTLPLLNKSTAASIQQAATSVTVGSTFSTTSGCVAMGLRGHL